MSISRKTTLGFIIGGIVVIASIVFGLSDSVERDRTINKESSPIEKTDTTVNQSVSQPHNDIHFFLENSGSIDGYLNPNSDFISCINRLIRDAELGDHSISTYYINSGVYESNKSSSEYLRTLTVSGVSSYGNRMTSDINSMFQEAIQRCKEGGVSILVSDGIYSLNLNGRDQSPEQLLDALNREKLVTRNSIVSAAEAFDLMTVVVKMESEFEGKYYRCNNANQRIDQIRPYYIWFFGNPSAIEQVVEDLSVEQLPGFVNQVKFIRSKNRTARYSILTRGDSKIGDFRSARGSADDVHEVFEAERAERGANRGLFGFSVAVDLSDIQLPNSYLSSTSHYQISSGYEMKNIYEVSDADEWRSVNSLDFEPTHIIEIQTSGRFLGDVSINLYNEVPGWIQESGNSDDTRSIDETTTFGFATLMEGITEGYEKLNESQPELLTLTLSVNP
ncbi:MAG: hypothetical protein HWE24_16685 [Oceanospirillaceae bacterium]|nr:hypothetical protein [Oceanospirillaceae bacterium]